jgi:2-methylisocitrate lyase-like PEP mutase family enzyme
MEKKLAAALTSRTDPDFCIIARTDARGVNGFDDAIQRGRAFARLGVDAVFIEAPQSEAELEEIPRALPNIPLLVNVFKGGKTPMLPVERLQQMGYRIAIYPSETQSRHLRHESGTQLAPTRRHNGSDGCGLTTFKDRDQIVGLDDWQTRVEYMALPGDKS